MEAIGSGHIEIANSLMKEIMYSNGMVDRWRPEPKPYPKKWVNKIAPIAGKFFDLYPDLLTDENISEMSDGDVDDNEKKYGGCKGWKELNEVLNDFFNNYSVPQKYKLVPNN